MVYKFSQALLVQAMTYCQLATDLESTRYVLGCVQIEIIDGIATCVATDGRRIHLATLEVMDNSPKDGLLLLPSAMVKLLASLPMHGEILLAVEEKSFRLEYSKGRGNKATRHINLFPFQEGRFPGWKQLIPSNEVGRLNGSAVEFRYHFDDSPSIGFKIREEDGKLMFGTDYRVPKKLPLEVVGSIPSKVFNSEFVRDAIPFEDCQCSMVFFDNHQQVILESCNGRFRAVIMDQDLDR